MGGKEVFSYLKKKSQEFLNRIPRPERGGKGRREKRSNIPPKRKLEFFSLVERGGVDLQEGEGRTYFPLVFPKERRISGKV